MCFLVCYIKFTCQKRARSKKSLTVRYDTKPQEFEMQTLRSHQSDEMQPKAIVKQPQSPNVLYPQLDVETDSAEK
jgi:hypothetical protein